MEERKTQRELFGEQLRQKRIELGWSVEQVAVMAGVKASTVCKVEDGLFNVPIDVVTRIADVLGCQVAIVERKDGGV